LLIGHRPAIIAKQKIGGGELIRRRIFEGSLRGKGKENVSREVLTFLSEDGGLSSKQEKRERLNQKMDKIKRRKCRLNRGRDQPEL